MSGGPQLAVVTTAGCPHCKRAKQALTEAGVEYREHNLAGALDVLAELKRATGKTTVPQVFVGGELIGGADETLAALADGSLQKRVQAASAPPLPTDLGALLESVPQDGAEPTKAKANLPADMTPEEYADLQQLASSMGSSNMPRETLHASSAPLLRRRTATPNCFTGSAAVDWMLSAKAASTAEEAAAKGQRLLACKLLRRVSPTGEPAPGPFQGGGGAIFQLAADAIVSVAKGQPLNVHYAWEGAARPASQVATDLRELIVALYDKFLSPDGKQVDYDGMKADPLFLEYVNASAELQAVSLSDLGRRERIAFFINIYNALIVHGTIVREVPDNLLKRLSFFSSLKYNIGGHDFSADDVEHGVLRGNKPSPASLFAILGKPQWAGPIFKQGDPRAQQAVSPLDPRIHFALVCGAKSCPPIRVYTPESLEVGLQAAATTFCEGSVQVDRAANKVTMSQILKWYGGDFAGSTHGVLTAVAGFLPEDAAADLKAMLAGGKVPEVVYSPYDWSVNKKE